jgi:hypothetical protein
LSAAERRGDKWQVGKRVWRAGGAEETEFCSSDLLLTGFLELRSFEERNGSKLRNKSFRQLFLTPCIAYSGIIIYELCSSHLILIGLLEPRSLEDLLIEGRGASMRELGASFVISLPEN